MTISEVTAAETTDSRGRPTIVVTVRIGDRVGTFSVPSGASTGSFEAWELRDPDGGMKHVIRNIRDIIAPKLVGCDAHDQRGIDTVLTSLDSTSNMSQLGGNAAIGVSIAVAKAAAAASGVQVFEHLRTLADIPPSRKVPLLYMNYINGGKHARSPIAFQEHMIVPDVDFISEALAIAARVETALGRAISDRYGSSVAAKRGDEGGFVIPEASYEAPFELIESAIHDAGGDGRVRIAIDAAAMSFYADGTYLMGMRTYTALELLDVYRVLASRFSLISIEDPFEETAFDLFAKLQNSIEGRVVGDDLTVTNTERIGRAAKEKSIRAVIIKPNQIGTLTATLDAMRCAREAGIDCIVSHRSGETSDDFIADLAYAFGCFGLKAGALRNNERVVKYKRLQAIIEK